MTFKNGEKKVDQFLYCLPCLNEVLLSLQKEGAIQQVQVIVEEPTSTEASAEASPSTEVLSSTKAPTT
jgi:hypothetical protein